MGKNKQILLIILGVTIIKIVMLCILQLEPQVFENTAIANNYIQSGEMYYLLDGNVDYNHQFPLFGWILILFFKLFGFVLLPVQIFQIVINGFFAFIVYKIYQSLFLHLNKSWIAYALVLIALLHPMLLYYQVYIIHPVTMDVFMYAFLTYMGLKWVHEVSFQNSLLLVFVIGVTVLERSTLIFAILPSFLLLLKRRTDMFRLALVCFIGVVLFLSPWVVRNYNYTGEYSLTSGAWRYLWVGSLEETEGTNLLDNGQSYYELIPKEERDNWSKMSLKDQMDFYRIGYLKRINENPTIIIKMWGVKIKNFFWFSSHVGNESKWGFGLSFYKVFHGILLLLSFIGLIHQKDKRLWCLMAGVLIFALVQSFYYVETRHAMPVQFVLWICGVLGLDLLITKSIKIVKNK